MNPNDPNHNQIVRPGDTRITDGLTAQNSQPVFRVPKAPPPELPSAVNLIPAALAPNPSEPPLLTKKQSPWRAFVAVAAVVLLSAGAILTFARNDKPEGFNVTKIDTGQLSQLNSDDITTGTLRVNGKAEFAEDVVIEKTLTVKGISTFQGNIVSSGSITAESFAGNGAALTNVDASQLGGQAPAYYLNATNVNTGTVADARLSANVALLGLAQTFSANKTFSGAAVFTGSVSSSQVMTQNGSVVCDTSNNCSFTSSASGFVQNGNSFAATAYLGTNDAFALAFETNGAERLRVDSTGNVGIGTTAPATTLHVVQGAGGSYMDRFGAQAALVLRRANGTSSSPSAVSANEPIGGILARGYGATDFSAGARAAINFYAAENWTDTLQGTYITLSTTAIGSNVDTQRVRIDSSGNVGIGTVSPTSLLHLSSDTSTMFQTDTYNNSSLSSGQLRLQRARGTSSAPLAVQSGDRLGILSFHGYDSAAFGGASAAIQVKADEAFTALAQGSSITLETTPIGSTSRQERLKVDNAGNVIIASTGTGVLQIGTVGDGGGGPVAGAARLDVYHNAGDSNTTLGNFTLVADPTTAVATTYRALIGDARTDSTNTQNLTTPFQGLQGVIGFARHLGSGTVATASGTVGSLMNVDAGTITTGSGVRGSISSSGAGTIVDGAAFRAASPSVTAGAITNAYGVHIDTQDVAGVGTGYGIYQVGTADLNYFGGSVGIGIAASTATLHAQGSAGVSSGAITMTASNGATTFTTSSSITLNAGDYIIPTTTTAQARAVSIGGTGTSFTVSTAFLANVAAQTFTIHRPVSNLTTNSGSPGLLVQGSTGNVGIGTLAPTRAFEINKSTTGGTVAVVKNPTAGTANYSQLQVASDTVTSYFSSMSSTWTTAGVNVQSGTFMGGDGSGGLSVGAINASGDIRLYAGGSTLLHERMRIEAGGNVSIGTLLPSGGKLEVSSETATHHILVQRNSGDTSGVNLTLRKSRGALGVASIVANGDTLGQLNLQGYDGDNYFTTAGLKAVVDGVPGTNDLPTRLEFQTTPDGSVTPVTRLTVLSGGNVGIGTTSPNAALQLAATTANRKIVLYEAANNDHEYYGLGVNNGVQRYQVSNTSADHVFYAGASSSTSNELMRITGSGKLSVGGATIPGGFGLSVTDPIYVTNCVGCYGVLHAKRVGDTFDRMSLGHNSLSFGGEGGANPSIQIYATGGASNDFAVYTGSTERLRVEADGDVGIGATTGISGSLDVRQRANGNNTIYARRNTDTSPTGNFLLFHNAASAELARLDIEGNLTVKAATFNGNITVNGHIITANTSGSTTVAAGAGAGTVASASISGNDVSGTVTINTGTASVGAGALATITFANAYGAAPRVVLTPRSAIGSAIQYYNGSIGTGSFTIDAGVAPTISTTYVFNYHVIQ